MAQQILQINFKFNVPREQYETTCSSLAEQFAAVPDCVWKVWLMNETDSEAGGIYLFADEAAVETFKGSPLVAAVLAHPALSDFNIKQFEVMTDVSRITRAPLGASAVAA
jgi:hypothetical protein